MKDFDGNEIQVHPGSEATLFVTNFPPIADEDYIRRLFSPVSVAPKPRKSRGSSQAKKLIICSLGTSSRFDSPL